MRKCNLDGHVKLMEYKKDAGTWAEKIAAQFHTKGGLPVKNSYMYCDKLDMCFFYDNHMRPAVAYAGYMRYGDDDNDGVPNAFAKSREVLEMMEKLKCDYDKNAAREKPEQ